MKVILPKIWCAHNLCVFLQILWGCVFSLFAYFGHTAASWVLSPKKHGRLAAPSSRLVKFYPFPLSKCFDISLTASYSTQDSLNQCVVSMEGLTFSQTSLSQAKFFHLFLCICLVVTLLCQYYLCKCQYYLYKCQYYLCKCWLGCNTTRATFSLDRIKLLEFDTKQDFRSMKNVFLLVKD